MKPLFLLSLLFLSLSLFSAEIKGKVVGVSDGDTITFAKKVLLKTERDLTLADEVYVVVNGSVESYAGIAMGNDYVQRLDVEKKINDVVVDSVLYVGYEDAITVTVGVLPADASKGKTVKVRSLSEDIVTVSAHEAVLDENGQAAEGGIEVEAAVMLPDYMKDEDEKQKFNGAKVGDVIVFNPSKAYNSDVELSSLLKITKDEAAQKTGDFQYQISEITRYEAHALNQELFDQVLGEGKVSDEAGFRAAIKETLESQFRVDSDFRFVMDLKKYIVARVGEVEFPEEILKRIMKLNNQDKDDEFIEKNFKPSVEELKWHLIKEQLCDQLEIKVEQPDVMETAKEVTRMQFAQYGMTNIPEDALENYAKGMLENKQQAEGLVNRTVERKLGAAVKAVVTLDERTVSLDEFNKAFEE